MDYISNSTAREDIPHLHILLPTQRFLFSSYSPAKLLNKMEVKKTLIHVIQHVSCSKHPNIIKARQMPYGICRALLYIW
jgi:hypothetical protein